MRVLEYSGSWLEKAVYYLLHKCQWFYLVEIFCLLKMIQAELLNPGQKFSRDKTQDQHLNWQTSLLVLAV